MPKTTCFLHWNPHSRYLPDCAVGQGPVVGLYPRPLRPVLFTLR